MFDHVLNTCLLLRTENINTKVYTQVLDWSNLFNLLNVNAMDTANVINHFIAIKCRSHTKLIMVD